MRTVNKYKDILLEWFYLDKEGNVRRAKDGYFGRYKKDDIVVPYTLCNHGYGGVHIPTTRTTVPYHHLLLLLRGIDIPNDKVIDHINGDTDNNTANNLRFVTQQLNCKNKRIRLDNKTGITGVNKSDNGYVVRKQLNGKRVYLGYVKTLEEAKELLFSKQDIITADGYTDRHGK